MYMDSVLGVLPSQTTSTTVWLVWHILQKTILHFLDFQLCPGNISYTCWEDIKQPWTTDVHVVFSDYAYAMA